MDTDFDGRVMFYEFTDPSDYLTYKLVGSKRFLASDSLFSINLNGIGSPVPLRMFVERKPGGGNWLSAQVRNNS
jgi:hypothetical protein